MQTPGRLLTGLLFAQLVGAMVDFGALGLTSADGLDKGKWLILAPGLVLGLHLLTTSAQLSRWLLSGPIVVLMMWFGWSFLGVAWSVDARATVLQMIVALTTTVTAFWWVRSFGRSSFARVFCAAAALVLIVGLMHDLIPALRPFLPVDTSQAQIGPDTGRGAGLTPGFNQLGFLAGVTVMLLLRTRPRNPVERVLAWSLAAVACAAMATSGSRSVAVCTIAAVAIQLGAASSPIARRRGIAASVAAGLLAISVLGAAGIRTPFQAGRSLDSLNGRAAVWSHALGLIEDKPLAGYGMMSGDEIWAQALAAGRTVFDAGDTHNMTLEILVGSGTIGLALFGSALAWAAFRAWATGSADAFGLLLLLTLVGLTEALVSAAGLVYPVLGLVMGLLAVDQTARPWPNGRGGNPGALLRDDTHPEPVGSPA
ncbi:MAG: O-antigen ligase family protein [Acidimicrobiales bacterium]